MKKGSKWTLDETIIAFYIYCKIPFSKTVKTNPTIINYANLLGRTPSALAMKLGNLGRLDPDLKKRGISGLEHGSKTEEIVWQKFIDNPEEIVVRAEKLINDLEKIDTESKYLSKDESAVYIGEEKERVVKTRIGQDFFRSSVLTAYNHQCAITGLPIDSLLIASHIKPWAADKNNRLNPHNGICLNAIHDRAFDQGLMTIDKNYKIVISSKIKEFYDESFVSNVFQVFEGQTIALPKKFKPSLEALEYHQDMIFLG